MRSAYEKSIEWWKAGPSLEQVQWVTEDFLGGFLASVERMPEGLFVTLVGDMSDSFRRVDQAELDKLPTNSVGTCATCGYHGPGPRHNCPGYPPSALDLLVARSFEVLFDEKGLEFVSRRTDSVTACLIDGLVEAFCSKWDGNAS